MITGLIIRAMGHFIEYLIDIHIGKQPLCRPLCLFLSEDILSKHRLAFQLGIEQRQKKESRVSGGVMLLITLAL